MMTLCYGPHMYLDSALTTETIEVEDQLLGLRSPSGNYLDYLPFLRRLLYHIPTRPERRALESAAGCKRLEIEGGDGGEN